MLHEIWLVWLLFVYLCKPWNRMKPSPSKISPYKYRTLTWRTKGVNPFVPGPISNRAFKRTAIYLICNEYSNSKYFMVLRSKMGFLRFTLARKPFSYRNPIVEEEETHFCFARKMTGRRRKREISVCMYLQDYWSDIFCVSFHCSIALFLPSCHSTNTSFIASRQKGSTIPHARLKQRNRQRSQYCMTYYNHRNVYPTFTKNESCSNLHRNRCIRRNHKCIRYTM